jgi:hypothetical protein
LPASCLSRALGVAAGSMDGRVSGEPEISVSPTCRSSLTVVHDPFSYAPNGTLPWPSAALLLVDNATPRMLLPSLHPPHRTSKDRQHSTPLDLRTSCTCSPSYQASLRRPRIGLSRPSLTSRLRTNGMNSTAARGLSGPAIRLGGCSVSTRDACTVAGELLRVWCLSVSRRGRYRVRIAHILSLSSDSISLITQHLSSPFTITAVRTEDARIASSSRLKPHRRRSEARTKARRRRKDEAWSSRGIGEWKGRRPEPSPGIHWVDREYSVFTLHLRLHVSDSLAARIQLSCPMLPGRALVRFQTILGFAWL